MPDQDQPATEDERPSTAAVAPGDIEPVVEAGDERGELSGGGEITDVAGESPSS